MSNSKYMTFLITVSVQVGNYTKHSVAISIATHFPTYPWTDFSTSDVVSILIRRSFPACPSRGWSWTVHCPRNPSRAFQSSCWGWNFVWQLPWRSRDLQLDPNCQMVRPEVCNPNSFGLSVPKIQKESLGGAKSWAKFCPSKSLHFGNDSTQPKLQD